MPTRLLVQEGHSVSVFYANSNIAPRKEYEKRLGELKKFTESQSIMLIEGVYEPEAWEHEVAPIAEAVERGEFCSRERCRVCYRLRLNEAACVAAADGYDMLASTLAVSPYQHLDVLHEELEKACKAVGVIPYCKDFRSYYAEATRLSREMGMYRQNYCGCRFSVKEAEKTRARIKSERAAAKAAREEARIAEEAARRKKAVEKQAYAEERARRRTILRNIRMSSSVSSSSSSPSSSSASGIKHT